MIIKEINIFLIKCFINYNQFMFKLKVLIIRIFVRYIIAFNKIIYFF